MEEEADLFYVLWCTSEWNRKKVGQVLGYTGWIPMSIESYVRLKKGGGVWAD